MKCSKPFSLLVNENAECIDWTALLWDVAFIDNVATFTPDSTTGHVFAESCTGFAFPGLGSAAQNTADLPYNGPECACNLHLVVTKTGDATHICANIFVGMQVGGEILLDLDFNILPAGVFDYPFNIPDTGGIPDSILVIANCQISCGPGPLLVDSSIAITGTFSVVP